MISHKYRCIFVEVPKTGSSSIRSILGMPHKPHWDIWQIRYELETEWTRRERRWDRWIAAFYPLWVHPAKRREAGQKIYESYFKFGFVRNPWDRVVSLYLRREGVQMRDKCTFEEFVDWIKYSSSTCIHPTPHVNQLDWLVDPSGNMQMDHVGRFETLDKDWAHIASKTGAPAELPHSNKNDGKPKKHYSEFYTDRTREIVARKFQTDIEFFGYSFERP